MPTFERTIDVLPFQGGTLNGLGRQQMLVRLTDSRMVWITGQTNPDWTFCSIIDVEGGITSTSEPVVKTHMFPIKLIANNNYNIQASRLNDNTFLVVSQQVFSFNSIANADTIPISYWVFSIDSNDVIRMVDSGTLRVIYIGTNSSINAVFGSNHNSFTFANVADNVVVANNTGYYSGVTWYYYKLTFDTVTNKLSYQTPALVVQGSNFSVGQFPDRGNWNVSKVPGHSDLTFLSYRVGNANELNGSISAIFDSNGDVYMSTNQLPQNTPVNSNPIGYVEMVPMAGDQLLVTSNKDAFIYSIDYSAKTWALKAKGTFTRDPSNDNFGCYAFPLDANYWFIMSRTQIQTPATGLRGKVVRMVDDALLEQNSASAGNSHNGFSIPVTLTTWLNAHKETPELINGKLFYWGFTTNPFGSGNGTSTTLSWTVIDLKNT